MFGVVGCKVQVLDRVRLLPVQAAIFLSGELGLQAGQPAVSSYEGNYVLRHMYDDVISN